MADFQPLREKLKALPVHSIIDAVVKDVDAGKVTVVAASTGSGKSMLLPGALADTLHERVVVLVPRRFLATDAAYNVAELSGTPIGDKVGYALGHLDGESSQRSENTTLLYCTYGYALSSGLINKARIVVLDEVHEADEYISLARAILRIRKTKSTDLRILEMSATVDARAQARYWEDIAATAVHVVEGQQLACDVVHESPMLAGNNGRTIEDIAVSLLGQGRKGIVVFRPGVKEVENSVITIKALLAKLNLNHVDVVGILGGTPSDERQLARKAPLLGRCKIIVGTNVIESGVNLRWLDAGVSDGYRKIPYHRDDTGAGALVREDQPQAGLLQQIGRINRDPVATGFARGHFILHAKKDFNARMLQNGPAIQRQALLSIAFYAASLGYDPAKLIWDITSQPHLKELPQRFEQAKQELMRLQLLHDDWSLTDDGHFIKHLPVGPEMGAMLCEARRLDEARMRGHKSPRVMRDAVIIAAIAESHGLRLDTNKGHKADQHYTSDMLDAMNAYRALRREPLAEAVLLATEAYLATASAEQIALVQKQRAELKALCEKSNISIYGFVEISRLVDEISSRLGQHDKGIRIDPRAVDDKYDAERYGELQRALLNGSVNRLYQYESDGFRDLLRDYGKARSNDGNPFNGYLIANSSIVPRPKEGALVVGELREIQVKRDDMLQTLLVLTDITSIPPDVFVAWAIYRAENHAPILSEVKLSGDGQLDATYAGKARFEIEVPHALRKAAAALV